MNKDEALKMAIEAFKTCETYNTYEQSFEIILVEKAINACKEALETNKESLTVQPAQEPVELLDEMQSITEQEYYQEPQYLYISQGHDGKPDISFLDHQGCIGKIKLEVDDE